MDESDQAGAVGVDFLYVVIYGSMDIVLMKHPLVVIVYALFWMEGIEGEETPFKPVSDLNSLCKESPCRI